MALSGSFYTNVGARWRLQAEWSATQNISANTSTVTTKLYWISLDSYGATSSSATKSGAITIDGTSTSFSGAGLASLTAGQKKLIATASKTVTHASDGTKSIVIGGNFVLGLTLGGTSYGTISLTNTTVTLNTIPRASSISSGQTWVAGSAIPVSISRAVSTFTHTVNWQVYNGSSWVTVKTASGVGASITPSWSKTEVKAIYTALAQSTSKDARITIQTYNGSTAIGGTVTSATGKVTAPTTSYTSALNGQYNNVNGSTTYPHILIDQTTTIGLTRNDANFLHDVKVTLGSFTKTLSKIGVSGNLTLSSAEQTTVLGLIPNDLSIKGTISITTFYEGVQVGAVRSADITYYVNTANSKPTFANTAYTYADTNATTVALTGSNQTLISGYSALSVTLSTLATANKGATIKNYVIKAGGLSSTVTATGTYALGIPTSTTASLTLTVTVYDSRGLYTETQKNISIIPYVKPTLSFTATRNNNYEASTVLKLSSVVYPIMVGTANKNSIKTVTYATKVSTATSYGTAVAFSQNSYNTTTGAYVANNTTVTLDNTKAYDVIATITDALSSSQVVVRVPVGSPIVFIDSDNNGVGIRQLGESGYALAVTGATKLAGKLTVSTGGMAVTGATTVSGTFGITGNTTITGTLTVSSNVTLSGTLTVTGATNLNNNLIVKGGSNALNLKSSSGDHMYMGFFPRTNSDVRHGYVGFGSAGSNELTVSSEKGNLVLSASSGSVRVDGTFINQNVQYPSLLNSWVNYTATGTTTGFERAGYYKDKNGNVFINGLVKGGAVGSIVFTLPTGYRPYATIMTVQNTNGAFARVDVNSAGEVKVVVASYPATWVSLSGITFKAV